MSVGYRHGEFVGVGEIEKMLPLYEAHRDWRALRRALTNQRGVDAFARVFNAWGEIGFAATSLTPDFAWPRFVVRYRPFDWERDA